MCAFDVKHTALCSRFGPYKTVYGLQMAFSICVCTDADSIDTPEKYWEKKLKHRSICNHELTNQQIFQNKIHLKRMYACISICTDWCCLRRVYVIHCRPTKSRSMRSYFSDKTHLNSMYFSTIVVWEWCIFYRIRDRTAERSVWYMHVCVHCIHTCIEINTNTAHTNEINR